MKNMYKDMVNIFIHVELNKSINGLKGFSAVILTIFPETKIHYIKSEIH